MAAMSSKRWPIPLAGCLLAVGAPLAAQTVDTVRVGSPSLRPERLVEGSYAIHSFVLADGDSTPQSTTTQSVARETRAGVDVYVVRSTHVTVDGDTTVGVITVRASDLSLYHHKVKAQADSAAITATGARLTAWVALPGEPPRLVDRELEGPVFPVEGPLPWLFPLLPLRDGYAAAIPHFSQWRGEEQWRTIRVTGSERVRVGDSEVDAWTVDGGELFPGYDVAYWVAKDTRRVVQGVARGRAGAPEYWSRARAP